MGTGEAVDVVLFFLQLALGLKSAVSVVRKEKWP